MLSALVVGLALHAAGQAPEPAPKPDLAAYEAEKARAGRDPDAQVRLALWCEAHGLPAQRFRHLALAVLANPGHAAARGLMGLVAYRGGWKSPEAVRADIDDDARLHAALVEYNRRREGLDDKSAEAHWRLAVWCADNGLDAESKAHLSVVVRLDPSRDNAWKRLGCRKVNGRWVNEAQIAADKREAEARKAGDAKWKPLLAKLRNELADPDKRPEAARQLAEVSDPHAVNAVWAAFVAGRTTDRDHATAVQLLGQIDAPRASAALATLAVSSESADVRRSAIETLRRRDTREYLAPVIARLRQQVRYEVRPVGGPGSPGALYVEGEQFNVHRLYAPPPMPEIPLFAGEEFGVDAYGLPTITRTVGRTDVVQQDVDRQVEYGAPPQWALDALKHGMFDNGAKAAANAAGGRARALPSSRLMPSMKVTETTTTSVTPVLHRVEIPVGQLMMQYQAAAQGAQQQLADDIRAIDASNEAVRRNNDRITQVLRGVTGADHGDDPARWTAWWVDSMGYVYKPPQSQAKPTVSQEVALNYLPPGVATSASDTALPTTTRTDVRNFNFAGGIHHFCFAAGTPVRTLAGPRPIETLEVGDRVLSQDVRTGALGYQPILAVFHNPPTSTLRVEIGSETVVTTPIHRFWKAGQGWVTARDLRPGDRLRTVGGTAEVRSIVDEKVQPVFNLQVAAGSSFFVGAAGTLVHDNSVAEPVSDPFDAPRAPAVASAARP